MSYAMYCATHGPQYTAPCPECGSWHTDPRPETPAEHEKLRKAIDAVRDTEPDYEHARGLMEKLGIPARIRATEEPSDCEYCIGTGTDHNDPSQGPCPYCQGGRKLPSTERPKLRAKDYEDAPPETRDD